MNVKRFLFHLDEEWKMSEIGFGMNKRVVMFKNRYEKHIK